MKQTFKTVLLIILFGVVPLIVYAIGLNVGVFETGLEMILGMIAWIAAPTAVIVFIIGLIQYFRINSK